MDDIFIYSKTRKEHKEHVKEMLQLLRNHKFHVKLKKCDFFQTQVQYSGHVILKGVDLEPVDGVGNSSTKGASQV